MNDLKTWQIIFAGVGGQGLVLAGNLLGRAAVEFSALNAVMTSVMGVETRGSFTKSDVIVSSNEITFPEALDPNYIIILDVIAYKRYLSFANSKTLLIVDSAIPRDKAHAEQLFLPISQIAKDTGVVNTANVVSLGVLVGLTGLVAKEAVEKAIKVEFAGRDSVIAMNLKALEGGLKASEMYAPGE